MPKLMIVDDHELILESLKFGLEDDFVITTVNNSSHCMEQVTKFNPDVVMLDFKMPGIDGLELTKQLMNTKRPPAIIMFSASMDEALEKEAKTKGVIACVSKPFDLEDLRKKVHQAAAGKSKR